MYQRSTPVSSPSRSSASTPHSPNRRDIVKIYLLQAKLDASAIAELYSLIESQNQVSGGFHLQLCSEASSADIILSNVHMRKRLERHLDWNIAVKPTATPFLVQFTQSIRSYQKQKVIVTPDWLRDSITQQRFLPYSDYAAIGQLRDETAKICNDCNLELSTCQCAPAPADAAQSHYLSNGSTHLTTSARVLSHYAARYTCQRASPLICPNQALASELNVLRQHRDLEGKAINALSYERAIALIPTKLRLQILTLKSYTFLSSEGKFNQRYFTAHLPSLPRLISRPQIREFIKHGHIEECETIRSSREFQSLKAFTTIHGVGPATARHLYSVGLRTIEDMERYYDIPLADDGTPILKMGGPIFTPNGKLVPGSDAIPDLDIKAALALRHDLPVSISRTEVEEMHDTVMSELAELRRGCLSTIVGSYRRGIAHSSDVDIVITHPGFRNGNGEMKDLCRNFLKRLYERGIITHVTRSGFFGQKSSHSRFLEHALTVFILPPKTGVNRLHRRLDLIFATPEAYCVGRTGSKMFERDLRLWAKEEKGLKFESSAITRRHDSKPFFPKSEEDVFLLLGLEWIDPTLRNANI
ncbi:hypothetical protein H0H92_007660 [Tricholoma furcatifolium]|nr:hypothetical protein H0H92_007660 [Tricholoma furcatifolium]